MAAPKLKTGTTSSGNSQSTEAKAPAMVPIPIRITKAEGQPPHSGMIVKLVDIGFLMKVSDDHLYKVAEEYQLYFELPEIKSPIKVTGKVVKTYDGLEHAGRGHVKTRTIEMHFKSLSDSDRSNLNSYLVKSGQRK